jgi:hypothetical protein
MPIKLPNVKHQTVEELRKERYDQYKPLGKRLHDAVQTLVKPVRDEYERWLYDGWMEDLNDFLVSRLPNGTARETYLAKHGIDEHWYPKKGEFDMRKVVAAEVAFVTEYTDHRKRPLYDAWTYDEWANNKARPNFEVNILPDTPDRLRAKAKKDFDHIVDAFLYRLTEKVLDILVANPKYQIGMTRCKLKGWVLEVDVGLKFGTKASFRVRAQLKYNKSVYGTPYVQYPLTFHDVVTKDDPNPSPFVSENGILEKMGIKPWKPTKSKKPWDTIGVGDIVRLKDKRVVIVVGTRTPKVKFFHPDAGEWDGTPEDIEYIEARTKGTEVTDEDVRGKDDVPWHMRRFFALRVEMFSGRVQAFKLDKTHNAELDQAGYARRDQKIRVLAFPLVLCAWETLTAPYEPPKRKAIRRRW